MIEVIADSVTVELPVFDADARSLRSTVLSYGSGGRLSENARKNVVVTALDNVSISIREGERLGVIGRNGAGKSTLLRTLAGIYEPTRGRVMTRGRVAPLFDVGLGMDQDATGYENIRIRGLFLGMTPEEIEQRTPEIAEFSELGPYLNIPIRTYSSGMRVRLSFSIATALRPEILLLDEMIGAGDASFIQKARDRLEGFLSHTRILVLASHSTEMIRRMCNRAILLHQGKVIGADGVDEILHAYESLIGPSPSGI